MTTQQPSYWCIRNIGDVDPLEHRGAFVLVDRTGVYSPVLLLLEQKTDSTYNFWDIQLDRLIKVPPASEGGGYGLSDNRHWPAKHCWFGEPESLQGLASFSGRPPDSLIDSFLSSCPVERALAYQSAAACYGVENFSYPSCLSREKAEALCDTMLHQIRQSQGWHKGYGVTSYHDQD